MTDHSKKPTEPIDMTIKAIPGDEIHQFGQNPPPGKPIHMVVRQVSPPPPPKPANPKQD